MRAGVDAAHAQPERQVLAHGLVRIERVALKDHRQVAVAAAARAVTSRPSMRIRPDVGRLESGDQPKHGALAAAGRPDQDEQLAVGDLERRDRAPRPGRSGTALLTLFKVIDAIVSP